MAEGNGSAIAMAIAAALAMGLAAGSCWAGAQGGAGPRIVVHPLTAEERLQERDYLAYEPLSEGADAFAKADPEALEARAAKLAEGGALTESPFVDWARYAALAVAGQDPEDPQAKERVARWGAYWARLRRLANERWEANRVGRADSIADNSLCAWRDGEQAKRACAEAAWQRAGQPPAPLSMEWGAWVAQAAAGLAESAKWPAGWEATRARIAGAPGGEARAAELGAKLERLDKWAGLLNPPPPPEAFDALAEARAWARSSCWRPGRLGAWGEAMSGCSESLGQAGSADGDSHVK